MSTDPEVRGVRGTITLNFTDLLNLMSDDTFDGFLDFVSEKATGSIAGLTDIGYNDPQIVVEITAVPNEDDENLTLLDGFRFEEI